MFTRHLPRIEANRTRRTVVIVFSQLFLRLCLLLCWRWRLGCDSKRQIKIIIVFFPEINQLNIESTFVVFGPTRKSPPAAFPPSRPGLPQRSHSVHPPDRATPSAGSAAIAAPAEMCPEPPMWLQPVGRANLTRRQTCYPPVGADQRPVEHPRWAPHFRQSELYSLVSPRLQCIVMGPLRRAKRSGTIIGRPISWKANQYRSNTFGTYRDVYFILGVFL